MTRTQAIEKALENLIGSVEAHQYGTGTLIGIRKCADEARTIKDRTVYDTAEPVAWYRELNVEGGKQSFSLGGECPNPYECTPWIPLYTHPIDTAERDALRTDVDARIEYWERLDFLDDGNAPSKTLKTLHDIKQFLEAL